VVRARILKETRPGSIVLSHDIHPGTIEAMPSTFDELEAKGFKFVTVSELIRMAAARPSRPSPSPSSNVSPSETGSPAPTPSPASSPPG
jgi:peptidoglycan-N-acetylglucosamine deacetylase